MSINIKRKAIFNSTHVNRFVFMLHSGRAASISARDTIGKNVLRARFPLTVAAPMSPRASQPSEGTILVNPSAYDATAAPGPDVWTDCNASVCGRRLRGHDFRRELLTRGP